MGWTQKLPSGKFQGRYRNTEGKSRSAGTFTQKKQAQREAERVESEQRQPGALDLDGGKIRWGDWFDTWHGSRVVSYATEKNYDSTAANHIRPYWGTTRLADIDTVGVAKWVKTLRANGASAYTIRNAYVILKASLQAAVDGNRLVRNPANGVKRPEMPDAVERFLTRDEVEAITFYMNGIDATVTWTAVLSGLRFGELAGLHWHRLDLDRGVINVVEKYDQAARRIDPLPKDREKRTVPLPDELVSLLRRHESTVVKGRSCGLTHTDGRCRSDLVFRGVRGAVLASAAWGVGPWRRALDLAGITDRVRVHDMRHTYASWLIQAGIPLADIAYAMGHSDSEITRRYAHLQTDDSDARIRDALSGSIRPRGAAAVDELAGLVSAHVASGAVDETGDESTVDNVAQRVPRSADRSANARHTPLYLVTPDDDENAS